MFTCVRNYYHDYHCVDLILLSLRNGDLSLNNDKFNNRNNIQLNKIQYFCYEVNPMVLNDENGKPMRALIYSEKDRIRNYQTFRALLLCEIIEQSNLFPKHFVSWKHNFNRNFFSLV